MFFLLKFLVLQKKDFFFCLQSLLPNVSALAEEALRVRGPLRSRAGHHGLPPGQDHLPPGQFFYWVWRGTILFKEKSQSLFAIHGS